MTKPSINLPVTAPELAKKIGLALWHSVTQNFGYKLLSVLIAVFLWSYVITSNPSITRDLTFSGIEVNVIGQTALQGRGLALLTDLSAEQQLCQVRLTVPQNIANMATPDNVRVELDLSGVRNLGKQKVRLRGTTVYGTIARISPQEMELDIENLDQRSVPVNVVQRGEKQEDLWYDVARINPMNIMVSGPSSLVQQASKAQVELDMTGQTQSDSRAHLVNILDNEGNELPSMLGKSTSSVTIGVDIYPTKLLPITKNLNELVTGELPKGYSLDGIEAQPAQIQVAADQVLLDSITSVGIEPIDCTDRTSSFTKTAKVLKLPNVKYSSDSVSVSIGITEDETTKTFSNVSAKLVNLQGGLRSKWNNPKLVVVVEGLFSSMQELSRNDLSATVDLSEITAPGVYDLPIQVTVDNFPELSCSLSPAVAEVTITAAK